VRDVFGQRIRGAVVCAIGIFALSFGACDDDEAEPSPSTTGTPAESATATARTATASPTAEPFSGGREPVEGAASGELPLGGALLVDVRVAEQADFDRITFELEGGLPGYSIQYVDPPIIADASGLEVEIDGSAFIQIRMEPAAGHDPNTGNETYTGPLELKPALPSLLEAERTGDFEGVLNWALGLSEEVDFRVTALDGPPRLVVDVGHP
jgi:hypothetical protein